MRTLKRAIIFGAGIIFLLYAWILINSIDDPEYDDSALLDHVFSVAEQENGFYSLTYIRNAESYSGIKDEIWYVKYLVHGESWNQPSVDMLLIAAEPIFEEVNTLIKKQHFGFSEEGNPFFSPSYSGFLDILNLSMLKAKNYFIQGRISDAIGQIRLCLRFNQKIKQDRSSNHLLSSAVAQGMDMFVMNWARRNLLTVSLSSEQYKNFAIAIDEVLPYDHPNFGRVFLDEYRNIKSVLLKKETNGMLERFEGFISSRQKWQHWKSEDGEDPSWAKPGMYEFMQVLFPRYYIRVNRVLKGIGDDLKDRSLLTAAFCKEAVTSYSFESDSENSDSDWKDIFLPGAEEKKWLASRSTWAIFFEDRCFHAVYIEAIRVEVALKNYKIEKGKYPKNLSMLVPDYLEGYPVDYFTGDHLLFSPEDGWVYARGMNYEDNGGSAKGVFDNVCRVDEGLEREKIPLDTCYFNPTIPMQLVNTQ